MEAWCICSDIYSVMCTHSLRWHRCHKSRGIINERKRQRIFPSFGVLFGENFSNQVRGEILIVFLSFKNWAVIEVGSVGAELRAFPRYLKFISHFVALPTGFSFLYAFPNFFKCSVTLVSSWARGIKLLRRCKSAHEDKLHIFGVVRVLSSIGGSKWELFLRLSPSISSSNSLSILARCSKSPPLMPVPHPLKLYRSAPIYKWGSLPSKL